MPLSKPFYRIIRPFPDGEYLDRRAGDERVYMLSNDYASGRSVLIRAYTLIERDLIELFDYIEPCDANLSAYSHRTYELLLRASTEFETNCKGILHANGYARPGGGNLDIMDYYKIEKASRLSEYQVILNTWHPSRKIFEPFKEWATGHTLRWYRSYNTVKHNRSTHFPEASLENVMASITALFAILFSQFYIFALNRYHDIGTYTMDDDGSIYDDSSLFSIIMPSSWSSNEQYDLDWDVVKATPNPIDKFSF